MPSDKETKKNNDSSLGTFNVKHFVKGDPEKTDTTIVIPEIVDDDNTTSTSSKPKRSRRTKFDSDPIKPLETAQNSMSYVQQNIPYEVAFRDTNQQLDETIAQLNGLSIDTMGDLQLLRSNKTLKNKYMVLGTLTEQAVAIINTKLSAIKEKNKVIGDINNLELKRLKDLKMDSASQDPDARIADLYSAFVNTPIGNGMSMTSMMAPAQQSMLMNTSIQPDFNRVSILPSNNYSTTEQAAWQNSLDPAQQRMFLQAKGSIDICVIYDESTGARRYAAIDKTNGQEISGIELPNPDSVWELNLNLNMKLAKDTNRGVTYPIIITHP